MVKTRTYAIAFLEPVIELRMAFPAAIVQADPKGIVAGLRAWKSDGDAVLTEELSASFSQSVGLPFSYVSENNGVLGLKDLQFFIGDVTSVELELRPWGRGKDRIDLSNLGPVLVTATSALSNRRQWTLIREAEQQ